ncbi:hypothetical protein FALCPG4_015705 [Fusarium falciforme]
MKALPPGTIDISNRPVGEVKDLKRFDPTGTHIGHAIASHREDDLIRFLTDREEDSPLTKITKKIIHDIISEPNVVEQPNVAASPAAKPPQTASKLLGFQEAKTATILSHLASKEPKITEELFRPPMSSVDRVLQAISSFNQDSPARSAFLSPIGILHLFREYFFQTGTFLGPPVGHVWVSPGGTVEMYESNTRLAKTERTTEQSFETVSSSEAASSTKDELSDAIHAENSTDTKFGATVTASGGFGDIVQASGSTSFSISEMRRQAQEQTHKFMREQSAKLSNQVRQNYKTTFRTVTETTDTSSRRYVLANNTPNLVSYELSRKMRRVAVQVQDLGQRLCWQVYVDNPGDPLGIGEFVHATGGDLESSVKVPGYIPPPENKEVIFEDNIDFKQVAGGDDDNEDECYRDPSDSTRGVHNYLFETNAIVFVHYFTCPAPPSGFEFVQVSGLDFGAARVKWDKNIQVDSANNRFTICLTYADFQGQMSIPFKATLVYAPTKATIKAIADQNTPIRLKYEAAVAAENEKKYYDTVRKHMKLSSKVQPRQYDDMREEERNIIYRRLITQLYGKTDEWDREDYHLVSELLRYFFDVDSMLYFVAPDWWVPRTKAAAESIFNTKPSGGKPLQTSILTKDSISDRLEAGSASHGANHRFKLQFGARRPNYLITEETGPAPLGASLGWLIQLDGDKRRNAFLNSPWVKSVLPIRPGREREAIAFLKRPEIADTRGLEDPYMFDPTVDPPEYRGLTLEEVLLKVADKINAEYRDGLKPVEVEGGMEGSRMALPTETVFAKGFEPRGVDFTRGPFDFFTEWVEVLPTDQVVATEYATKRPETEE